MSVTTGTFPGIRMIDMPDLGAFTDDSFLVGEHLGSGLFRAPALKDYIAALPLTGGLLDGPGNLTINGDLTVPLITSGTQVGGPFRHVNPANDAYNITSNNIGSHTDPWFVSFVNVTNAGGSASPLTGICAVNDFLIQDAVSVNGNLQGVSITHNVAPNGNTARGSRSAFTASLVMVGSSQGGSITGTSVSSGGVVNAWSRSNLGGSSSAYLGVMNGLNTTMRIQNGSTFLVGGSGFEVDTSAENGSSYAAITQLLNVALSTHQVKGYLNENVSLLVAAQSGALNDLMYGVRFAEQAGDNPFDPKAKLIYVGTAHESAIIPVATNMDFGNTQVGAFHARSPYSSTVPLQANAITGATRLTSDGLAASSFVYEAIVVTSGADYTSNPVVTVTGGTGVVVNAIPGTGSVVGRAGVSNPGTNVPPEATATVSGPGTGGTIELTTAGNTMNFAINSAVNFDARIVMRSTTGEAICWSCSFGARMGATASTTAIIGSPTWTQVWATAGAPAAIGISAPVADTALGAINITVTPTSGTWSGGGRVQMTKSSRV